MVRRPVPVFGSVFGEASVESLKKSKPDFGFNKDIPLVEIKDWEKK